MKRNKIGLFISLALILEDQHENEKTFNLKVRELGAKDFKQIKKLKKQFEKSNPELLKLDRKIDELDVDMKNLQQDVIDYNEIAKSSKDNDKIFALKQKIKVRNQIQKIDDEIMSLRDEKDDMEISPELQDEYDEKLFKILISVDDGLLEWVNKNNIALDVVLAVIQSKVEDIKKSEEEKLSDSSPN